MGGEGGQWLCALHSAIPLTEQPTNLTQLTQRAVELKSPEIRGLQALNFVVSWGKTNLQGGVVGGAWQGGGQKICIFL